MNVLESVLYEEGVDPYSVHFKTDAVPWDETDLSYHIRTRFFLNVTDCETLDRIENNLRERLGEEALKIEVVRPNEGEGPIADESRIRPEVIIVWRADDRFLDDSIFAITFVVEPPPPVLTERERRQAIWDLAYRVWEQELKVKYAGVPIPDDGSRWGPDDEYCEPLIEALATGLDRQRFQELLVWATGEQADWEARLQQRYEESVLLGEIQQREREALQEKERLEGRLEKERREGLSVDP